MNTPNVEFVNLRPHDITLFVGDATILIPPSGQIAQVSEVPSTDAPRVVLFQGNLVQIRTTSWGPVVGLPAPQSGTLFVVSAIVKEAVRRTDPSRVDVVSPDTGLGVVRAANGKIAGTTGFKA
jgi:hypothetical protein